MINFKRHDAGSSSFENADNSSELSAQQNGPVDLSYLVALYPIMDSMSSKITISQIQSLLSKEIFINNPDHNGAKG